VLLFGFSSSSVSSYSELSVNADSSSSSTSSLNLIFLFYFFFTFFFVKNSNNIVEGLFEIINTPVAVVFFCSILSSTKLFNSISAFPNKIFFFDIPFFYIII
jgi:hypothetical protein